MFIKIKEDYMIEFSKEELLLLVEIVERVSLNEREYDKESEDLLKRICNKTGADYYDCRTNN